VVAISLDVKQVKCEDDYTPPFSTERLRISGASPPHSHSMPSWHSA